jgi:hypothetical protein
VALSPSGYSFAYNLLATRPRPFPYREFRVREFEMRRTRAFGISDPRLPMSPVPSSATCGPHSNDDREFTFREFTIPIARCRRPLQVPIPDMGGHLSIPKCYDCGTRRSSEFRDFSVILSTPRSPKCRTPMYLRALSSTSPLPRRAIRYRGIAISVVAIPLHGKIPNAETPTLRITDTCPVRDLRLWFLQKIASRDSSL